MVDLVAPKLHLIPPSSYTVEAIDGSHIIDASKKAILEQVRDRLLDKATDAYSKFVNDWERFYATIMTQLSPATKEELQGMISGRLLLIV